MRVVAVAKKRLLHHQLVVLLKFDPFPYRPALPQRKKQRRIKKPF